MVDMIMRRAHMSELAVLKEMYARIVERMNARELAIWDDVYPVEFLQNDIECNSLYVFERSGSIVAACALSDQPSFENQLSWSSEKDSAIYLDRFGVNVEHSRQGAGTQALELIEQWSREQGAGYLRLLVACSNLPAIALYEKCGFIQVGGIHRQVFEDGSFLEEFGFEKRL